MKNVLLYIWQLPQNLLGLAVIHFSKAEKTETNGIVWYKTNCLFGVSLGNYIVLYCGCNETDVKHEHGHQIQSMYFGWLYLLLVGLPSAVFNNLWDRFFHRSWSFGECEDWYYKRYPEKWADKLGGVERK